MTDWVEVYRPLIGKRLDALIWMPIRADTPDLVKDMNSPAFSFSGGVFLAFEEQTLFLSWKQAGLDHVLGTGPDAVWSGYALDRVRVSWDRTWESVEGATLIGVEFFIGPTTDDAPIDEREIMAVRHRLRLDQVELHFWIGTGGRDFVGSADDLWVGAGVEPSNFDELTQRGAVAP